MNGIQRDFLVPDLGEGLEDATVSSWCVAVGDQVELNQTLCTLETAKAEVEIPSPYAGRVSELGGAVGDVLPVGSVLVRIETEAATDAVPKIPAKTNGVERNPVLVGYGTDAAADTSRRQRPRAKPAVRKLAAELLVDLADLQPGPDGVITRQAVLAAAGVHGEQRPGVTHDVLPVRGVHAEMAKRMTLSRRDIPDAHAGVEVDGTRLLELRDTLGLTPFALTMRLLVLALGRHRILNSTWVDGPDGPQVHTHHAIHLGVAVATPRGLLVPVVRDAQAMTTRVLAEELTRLIGAGRDGTLRPAELTGSTFSVSNFGPLGLDDGVPVINHPEAAILGMGSLRPRAVVVDGALAVRSTMKLTCAFDHRVADGAQVAGFLTELRDLIERPETALLDL
ncbi:MAG: dihydrolipoamide acetyltransferase family protein [Mycobacterium sp.]|nr:dihydrolipoamide acetyltransferase family protein [Mycobacterium sp.]